MYSKSQKTTENNKNPARVSGGLRAQNADSFVLLDENGSEKQIPSQRYVMSLEEQLKSVRQQNTALERKTTRLSSQVDQLEVAMRNLLNR